MSGITGKNISKRLSGKYSQKLLDNAKQSATDALKTSLKRVVQKTAEETGDLIGNKIANKTTKVWKNLERVTNENDKEILKERYLSPEKRQEIKRKNNKLVRKCTKLAKQI